MLSCYNVANYFIYLANEAKKDISNLKLQKLVYYSQALYLAIHEKPLFPQAIEAWELGPVVPLLVPQVPTWLSDSTSSKA